MTFVLAVSLTLVIILSVAGIVGLSFLVAWAKDSAKLLVISLACISLSILIGFATAFNFDADEIDEKTVLETHELVTFASGEYLLEKDGGQCSYRVKENGDIIKRTIQPTSDYAISEIPLKSNEKPYVELTDDSTRYIYPFGYEETVSNCCQEYIFHLPSKEIG